MNNTKLQERFEIDEFEKLKRDLIKYNCALAEVLTQLNNINSYFNAYWEANPIEHIKSRIKAPESIAGKLKKKGLPVTAESAEAALKDIAGVRIICSYAKNIYEIVEILRKQHNFKIVKEKDYISEAKASGYRSYHLILEVDLGELFDNQVCPVELQIRTSAMDFWATLEHKVRYKYGGDMPVHLSEELQNCAQQIHALDERMYLIHELVDLINEGEDEND
ncbi:GTP pyrophosphokinase [Lactococcus termiticola]|uniref:GTP pyrophosphokinase n=1 Tax=Lactococcus termiticola TaxID=2169526 RepID=A0A2R5HER1_9LACT|nr:GTP pyrophosphokinase family protein [Lactococcus termiticola]GBG96306.1 GTP pyrophosphokinase [Lactococcus termiticola]